MNPAQSLTKKTAYQFVRDLKHGKVQSRDKYDLERGMLQRALRSWKESFWRGSNGSSSRYLWGTQPDTSMLDHWRIGGPVSGVLKIHFHGLAQGSSSAFLIAIFYKSVKQLLFGRQSSCLPYKFFMMHRNSIILKGGIIFRSSHACVCPTLWDPLDWSPLGSSVRGISHARILEWVASSFSRGSSWSRDWTHVSSIGKPVL